MEEARYYPKTSSDWYPEKIERELHKRRIIMLARAAFDELVKINRFKPSKFLKKEVDNHMLILFIVH